MLGFILLFTFLSSALSLFLVTLLLLKETLIKNISFHFVSFAAGALLAAGLTDILPEAVELNPNNVFVNITIFIAMFFLIEKVFFSMHHHEQHEGTTIKLPLPFLLFGDTLHNFLDGISIASTFLVSVPSGIITSIAVFIHEIPQELGDFGIMLHMGYSRNKVLKFNIISALSAFAGALLGFYAVRTIEGVLPILLSLTAANFIYLSLSDLLPELHHKTKGNSILHTLPFFLGVILIILLTQLIKE